MPSTSTKPNYPVECKPNINDLRQLFDDNSRHEHKRHSRQSSQPSASHNHYNEMKHTSLDENIFEMKSIGVGGSGVGAVNGRHHQPQSLSGLTGSSNIPSARNIDFERVKQKFDKPLTSGSAIGSSAIPSSSSSSTRNSKKSRNFSSFLKFNSRKTDSPPNDTETNKLSRNRNNNNNNSTSNNNNINNNINFDSNDFNKENTIDKLLLSELNQKKENYMNSSFNLDALKVSEDDDDVSK